MDYAPAPHVLDALKQVTLAGVVGPSGAGKTTLIEAAAAADPTLHLVISETSRAPRLGERHGVDYSFRSREAMQAHAQTGDYVQMPPTVTGDLYASAPESYAQTGVAIMAIWADAIPAFRTLPFQAMRTIFITPPSFAVWQARLGEGRNALAKRLEEAHRSLAFALYDNQTVFIINDDRTAAAAELALAAHGRPFTPKLEADQAHAREIIRTILAAI